MDRPLDHQSAVDHSRHGYAFGTLQAPERSLDLLRADSGKHARLSGRPCGSARALYVHPDAGRAAVAPRPHANHHRAAQLAMLLAMHSPVTGVVEPKKAPSRESHGHQELSLVNE